MTNFEKIKNMSVEEMAKMLFKIDCYKCLAYDFCNNVRKNNQHLKCIGILKQWLGSEAN